PPDGPDRAEAATGRAVVPGIQRPVPARSAGLQPIARAARHHLEPLPVDASPGRARPHSTGNHRARPPDPGRSLPEDSKVGRSTPDAPRVDGSLRYETSSERSPADVLSKPAAANVRTRGSPAPKWRSA